MADRYWRGITSDDWGNTANWSNTSGGSTGFSIPTSADNVFFDANGNNNCSLGSNNRSCNNISVTDTYTSTFDLGIRSLSISGNVTLGTGMSLTATTGLFSMGSNNTVEFKNIVVPNLTLSRTGSAFSMNFVGVNNVINLTHGGNGSRTLNGGTLNISGDISLPIVPNIVGTTLHRFVGGTGTWSGGAVLNNLEVVSGTLNITGTVGCPTLFTYTSGTVNAGASTFILGQASNFVINSTGFALNNLNPSTFSVTFSGTNGCTINNFSSGVITAGVTHTFQSLNTYNIATLNVVGTISSPATIRSSTPSSQAIITLTNASYNYALNVTDINSGLGAAGFTSGGILTNATNWTTAAAALYYIGSTNYSGTNLWSVISGGSPISAITAPTSSDPVIFDANSGNCIMNVAGVARSVNFANYTNTITFSNSLTVSGNITLGIGMVIAGAGTLAVNATSTLTSNGVIFPNTLELRATATYTLADNWTINTLNIPVNTTVTTLNNNTIYVTNYNGGNGVQNGSTIIYFNGAFGDGTFNSGYWNYTTSIIDTPNSLISSGLSTTNAPNITITQINGELKIDNLTCGAGGNVTFSFLPNTFINYMRIIRPNAIVTITNDIYVGTFQFFGQNTNANGIVFNGVGKKVYVADSLGFSNTVITGTLTGTVTFEMIGSGRLLYADGVAPTGNFVFPIIINTDGIITLPNSLVVLTGGLTFVKGKIAKNNATIILNCNIFGVGKSNFDNVQIVGGASIQMDEFFSGSPDRPVKVTSTTTANYTINFTDGFEKLAKNVRVSRCTISRRGQLLLLSKGGFGVNNLGIRYYNQLPNGVSTDTQRFVNNNLAGMPPLRAVNMLVGDPAFT